MSYCQKILNQQNQPTIQSDYFNRLRDLPFWLWDPVEHSTRYDKDQPFCCFNHAIRLPQKNSTPMALFDYQKTLLDTVEQHKYNWLKKSTGIGATTLFLRWIAWMALKDDAMHGKEMAVIVGPNIDLAIGLINRIKQLFILHGITFDTKQTEVVLNGCLLKAYPSNHLDAEDKHTSQKPF